MRWSSLIVIGLIVAGCHKSVAFRDRGLSPSLTTTDALNEALSPRRFAILIGVDEYEDPAFPALKYAGADARDLGARLSASDGGGFDKVWVLTSRSDTKRDNVVRMLRELETMLRREDVVLIYFSGHGTRVVDGDRWRRFLMVSDTEAGDLSKTALDISHIQRWLGSLPTARKALIIDACFRGDGKSVVRTTADEPGMERVTLPSEGSLSPSIGSLAPGEAHLFATTAGRPAREFDALGHGVYTFYLLDALSWEREGADLDRDGVITAFEAHDYARSRTMDYTNQVQIPEAAFRVVGEADIVLAGSASKRKARQDTLLYLYTSANHRLADAVVMIDGRDRGTLPGTLVVPSGRHHVAIQNEDGVVVDGYVRFPKGGSYRADDLARIINGPTTGLATRGAWFWSPSLPGIGPAGVYGAEFGLLARVSDRNPKGLYGGIGLGAGRTDIRGDSDIPPRLAIWATPEFGWQKDFRQTRIRLGAGSTTLVLPPRSALEGSEQALGYWVLGFGPSVHIARVLGGGWSLTLGARPHAAFLDLEGDGRLRPELLLSTTTALEVAF